MVLSLLFGKKYDQSRVGDVFLDATLSETHQYTAKITSYPLEDGRDVSDHIIKDPPELQISGIVSDTPLNILSAFNRSVDSFERLVRMFEAKQIITVVTGIKVYLNMVIVSLQVPRNVNSGQSLTFNIDLQRINLDSSVNLTLNENNPFTKAPDKIPREIVADANKYPYIQYDPITSLKDQASSQVDIGIQDLLPIPNNIIGNVNSGLLRLNGFNV